MLAMTNPLRRKIAKLPDWVYGFCVRGMKPAASQDPVRLLAPMLFSTFLNSTTIASESFIFWRIKP